MKSLTKLFLFALSIFVYGCNSLDIKPLDIITDGDILSSMAGIKTYVAGLYRKLPMEDFTYYHGKGWKRDWNIAGDMSGSALTETYSGMAGCDRMEGFEYWPYPEIRDVNHYIKYLETHPEQFSGNQLKELIAEAHFIRAFYYFGLVKRYGGVPIITEEQDVFADPSSLLVSRETEEKVWDFIYSELILAYDMPETSEPGRANRYVAAALMSRAMLYAGSIAKYTSSVDFKGDAYTKNIIGAPASKAQTYFQAAYDAADMIIRQTDKYELYRADADKCANYMNLFLDEASKENIFIRQYSIDSGTESCWDINCVPQSICGSSVCSAYPTMNLIEMFQEIDVIDDNGEPHRYNNLSEPFVDIEPRLKAILYCPGDFWNGNYFDMQKGLYKHFEGLAEPEMNDFEGLRPNFSNLILTNEHTQMYEGKLIIGQAGISTKSQETQTGFYRKKYFDYKASSVGWWTSEHHYIEFRLAEIMLNRAEAAFELGIKIEQAKADIKAIRDRAGAVEIPDAVIDLSVVREERRRELAFENHLLWDLRRWRTAHLELDKTKIYGLYPYYIFDEDKFIFLRQRCPGQREYSFQIKAYYEKLPQKELDKNPNLYPNNPEY